MSDLDRRLNAYRPDLAAQSLQGQVEATRFVAGETARVVHPVLPVRPAPDAARPRDTEFLFGEPVTVYDTSDGWSWVQSQLDGYVGYVDATALSYSEPSPTHRVAARRTHLYPAPELKRFAVAALPHGALVHVVDVSGRWSQIADGQWLYSAHLVAVDHRERDPVAVAERFLETPYLWGGRSSEGMDCSALVQFALSACGITCPRDSDMQERLVGTEIDFEEAPLQRGDLAFWPGHVGILTAPDRILHCNATDMSTRVWTLPDLRAHIRRAEETELRAVRRP
ncbi:MAG: NlpC/P60 family protein [Alphaproteobacteria bacterium]|nr:NlpC/P60 family protein [Alphaproteobacteria bacterium]